MPSSGEHFHACPVCGQTVIGHAPRACDRCAALERARAGGEPLQLFTPAPVQMPGQTAIGGETDAR